MCSVLLLFVQNTKAQENNVHQQQDQAFVALSRIRIEENLAPNP